MVISVGCHRLRTYQLFRIAQKVRDKKWEVDKAKSFQKEEFSCLKKDLSESGVWTDSKTFKSFYK